LPWLVWLLLLPALLAGCTISLAPAYDPSLVEGIRGANERALALFSAVEDGSPAADFPDHAATYDEVIGRLGALRMQAEARPVPPLADRIAATLADVGILDDVCEDAADCVNTSPRQLTTAADNLARMRRTHRDQGLEPDVVELFRNAHEISISQAMKVELALKRE
jgi:hypothetical protein